ncbi:MAG: DUF3828 domain-containing protein [Holophagales bacterium]|nr:DUF3828 domain-containing protein [Holophagales bacterium]
MRRSWLVVLLAGLSSLAAGAPAPPQPAGPEALVTAVYRRIVADGGEAGGQFFWGDPKVRGKSFSRELLDLWERAAELQDKNDDGVGAVDWDPVTASQDPMVKSFTTKVERSDATSATVAVTLVDGRGRRAVAADEVVRWDLVRESGAWKVGDIRGSVDGKPWSVRASLKAYIDQ